MRDCKKFCRPNLTKHPKDGDIIIYPVVAGNAGIVTAKEYERIKKYFKKISDYDSSELSNDELGGGGANPAPVPGPTPTLKLIDENGTKYVANSNGDKNYVLFNNRVNYFKITQSTSEIHYGTESTFSPVSEQTGNLMANLEDSLNSFTYEGYNFEYVTGGIWTITPEINE